MVKNKIELFRSLFALGREMLIFVVRYKQMAAAARKFHGLSLWCRFEGLSMFENQSITNVLTASVVFFSCSRRLAQQIF